MPTFSTTAKHALRWLTGINAVNDIDAGFQALAEDIDAKLSAYSQGPMSARPVSTVASPGITGRHYYATDLGLEFIDYGTGWAPAGIPIGAGFDWFATGDPSPELMIMDGRALSRVTYAALFAKLGTTFGAGNGTTTFNLPSTADRTLVGVSGTIARGAAGGEKTHTLTVAEMPSHSHTAQAIGVPDAAPTVNVLNSVPVGGTTNALGSTGGGGAHNNMQPYLGAYKVIRVI